MQLIKAFVLFGVIALAGCESVPVIEYVEVEVPVTINCVDEWPNVPEWATANITKQSTLSEAADAYMIELEQRKSYEADLEAVILGCDQDDDI
jgi:hypothetical protein